MDGKDDQKMGDDGKPIKGSSILERMTAGFSAVAKTLGDLGIEPLAMASVLPDYLWRFRPSGQYAAIKDSSRNLKSH